MNKKRRKFFINVACGLLFTSVIMDSYLWIKINYMVPSWTIAVMSLGFIVVLLFASNEMS